MSTIPPGKRLINDRGDEYVLDPIRGPIPTGKNLSIAGQPNYQPDQLGQRQLVPTLSGAAGEDLYIASDSPSVPMPSILAILLLILLAVLYIVSPFIYFGWLLKKGISSRPHHQLWILAGLCASVSAFNPISPNSADVRAAFFALTFLYNATAILLSAFLLWRHASRWSQLQLSPSLAFRLRVAWLLPLAFFVLWLVSFIVRNSPNLAYAWYGTLALIILVAITCLLLFLYNTALPSFYYLDLAIHALLPTAISALLLLFPIYLFTHPDLTLVELLLSILQIPSNAILVGVAGGLAGWLGVRLNARFAHNQR